MPSLCNTLVSLRGVPSFLKRAAVTTQHSATYRRAEALFTAVQGKSNLEHAKVSLFPAC